MNVSGAIEARLLRGLLFPRGSVAPQATVSLRFVAWTPAQIAEHICA